MQPKQMTNHQMTNRQMTNRQITHQQFTRQHGMHEHSMTIAQPQQDKRVMAIPSGTFEELGGGIKMGGLPFRWLRTWLFSLIALVALPVGGMLAYVGTTMQAESSAWLPKDAIVDNYNEESGVDFHLDSSRRLDRTEGRFNFQIENFFSSDGDSFSLNLSVCDLLSRFIVPQAEDASFSVWQHPSAPERFSCIPVSSDTGALLILAGGALLLFAAWRLLRTISAAATKPNRSQFGY